MRRRSTDFWFACAMGLLILLPPAWSLGMLIASGDKFTFSVGQYIRH